MPANPFHTAIPLASLIAMLKSEGFDISTSTLLDIQKVLANLNKEELNDFRELKTVLSPFICRNKEEQEHFNKVFDKYAATISRDKPGKKAEPVLDVPWKKILKITVAIVLLSMASYGVYYWLDRTKPAPVIALIVETKTGSGEPYALQNDTVSVRIQLNDAARTKKNITLIKIHDSLYENVMEIQKSFSEAGEYRAMGWLLNLSGDTIARALPTTIQVKCERPPSVTIQKQPNNGSTNSQTNTYIPEIRNPSGDSSRYKFNWYINDRLFSTEKVFISNYRSDDAYRVSLLIKTDTAHCSTDSLTADFNEVPPYELSLVPTKPLQLKKDTNYKAIIPVLLYGFIIPTGAVALLLLSLRRKKKTAHKPKESNVQTPQKYDGPYKLEFKTQNDKIATEKEISQLAEAMRKRHVGEVMSLNIRQTIKNTIRTGGLPSLIFTPRTQPTDFLIFLDKGGSIGHQVQLFEYVLKKLHNEQVNIIPYQFYKEPLLLSNEKLNHSMLPVDKISRLYPDTVLFIFSNTEAFFQSMNRKFKPWVTEKFKVWQHKIIITPVAVNDWDYKETALLSEGFTVVPADLNAHHLIIAEINNLINKEKLKKLLVSPAYSSRFINFDEWNELKEYLGDDQQLVQWVCALAVYPYVDWKVTVAIGKNIEEHSPGKNPLVTYSNLLKISRIKWMQTGVQPDELRVHMLQHLDNRTEVIARETMVRLLKDLEPEINASSLIKDEFDLNKTVNRFLLHTQNPGENTLTEDEKELMKEYVHGQQLDYPLEKYLNSADKTLLKDQRGEKSIAPGEYFKTENLIEKKKITREIYLRRAIAAAIILASLLILSRFFGNESNYRSRQQLADIAFNLTPGSGEMNADLINLSIATADSLYIGEKISDTSFVFRQIFIDSAKPFKILVETQDGNIALERPIDLKWQVYNLSIVSPASRTPLYIRYNNTEYFKNIETQLNNELYLYNISAAEQNFTDSSRIVYYEQNQKPKVDSIVDIVKKMLGKNVTTEFIEEIRVPPATPILFLNLTPTEVCNNISISALSPALNEIWVGGNNRNFMAIDLEGKQFHYATNSTDNSITYRIENVCLGNEGIYKIAAGALIRSPENDQFFFIRNIQSNSFELAACPLGDRTANQTPLSRLKPCGEFITMRAYYRNSFDTVFLPISSFSLVQREKNKLDRIVDSIKKLGGISIKVYENQNGFGIKTGQVDQILRRAKIDSISSLTDYTEQNRNEFDRNYITLNSGPTRGLPANLTFNIRDYLVSGVGVRQVNGANKGSEMKDINAIVIHASIANSLKSIIAFQTTPSSQESEHIIIDRNGDIVQLVPFNRVAYHAGQSTYNGARLNETSIAITLINCGRVQRQGSYYLSLVDKAQIPANRVQPAYNKSDNAQTYWETYTPAQINAVTQLCKLLKEKYNIRTILGHDEVDPAKLEPGPLFPMQQLRSDVFEDVKQQKY